MNVRTDGKVRDVDVELANALMASFCRALESSTLPPIHVLQMMARSLGEVYRKVANEHQKGECPCGWRPDRLRDLESIQEALVTGVMRKRQEDLASMTVAGRA